MYTSQLLYLLYNIPSILLGFIWSDKPLISSISWFLPFLIVKSHLEYIFVRCLQIIWLSMQLKRFRCHLSIYILQFPFAIVNRFVENILTYYAHNQPGNEQQYFTTQISSNCLTHCWNIALPVFEGLMTYWKHGLLKLSMFNKRNITNVCHVLPINGS